MVHLLPRTFLKYFRLLMPAALLAATAAVGGSAIGESPIACAEPREWDIGAYDQCVDVMKREFIQRDHALLHRPRRRLERRRKKVPVSARQR